MNEGAARQTTSRIASAPSTSGTARLERARGSPPSIASACPTGAFPSPTRAIYSSYAFDFDGNMIPAEEFERRKFEWLPSAERHRVHRVADEGGARAGQDRRPGSDRRRVAINGQPFEVRVRAPALRRTQKVIR